MTTKEGICQQLVNNSFLFLVMLSSFPIFACLWERTMSGGGTDHIKVYVSTDQAINVVSDRFISVAISSGEIKKHWNNGKLNVSSTQLQTLSSSLHPMYLRLGGTNADFLLYKDTILESHKPRKTFKNYTMTDTDWDDINQFCRKVGSQPIFDVNVLLRNGSDWDDSNFRKILSYNSKQGYQVYWELGNEPNHFGSGKVTNMTISGKQLALDYRNLRSLLDSFDYYRHNFIMGPSVTRPRIKTASYITQTSLKYLTDFYKHGGGDAINVSTWHQYYVDGRIATEDNFTDPDILDYLKTQIKGIKEIVYKYKPGSRIWLGETSSAYGGGADGLSNAYIAGFMWLDKLGVAALNGIDVVIRQTLYGGNYALLDKNLKPLPDWWLSLLYKRLVGQRVLKVTTSARGSDLSLRLIRSYAHCTLARSEYVDGDVTVYILNLDKYSSKSVSINQFSELKRIDQYLLTPHGESGMRSQHVNLNGVKLEMVDERTLPNLPPKKLDRKQDILLPPLSFGFYVMKGANASACLK
ncbi:heparanase-like isoform X2 [Anneissia japonica]|uniref:heparanase-like isoform X2 n=1 Tax=Anneissia japonica TaxID=1529436 RepID=UPI001425AE94|nr:heparanase-like isoform X2 [Anneissia japonica]